MREIVTEFTDPHGVKGYVAQAYDAESATYYMNDALLTNERWVESKVPLVPGKGVPAFTCLTIRIMKQLQIAPGTLRRLIVRGNHHVESVLQLARAAAAGAPLDDAVCKTTSYQSIETPMIQARHRVAGVRVVGGQRDRIAVLLDWHAHGGSRLRRAYARDRTAEHAAVLAKYGNRPDDIVLFDYETHVDLTAW
jgi:hypothetical protein